MAGEDAHFAGDSDPQGRDGDPPDIARIYNVGISERTATFETAPCTVAQIEERLRKLERYPLLVAIDSGGAVVGWAGLGEYRPRTCYAGIAEFSIYLSPEASAVLCMRLPPGRRVRKARST